MARRKSLNRRASKRSINNTGILNEDSNIIEGDDPLWWRRLENKVNSIRPSGRFTLGESSTTSELNANSTINTTDTSDNWWEILQKTSQDLVTKKVDKNDSKTTSKKIDVSDVASGSDSNDQLHEPKKRKMNFRRTRKSLGKNAFLEALNSSESQIESEPAPTRNSYRRHSSFQSLKEQPSRQTRQLTKNDSVLSNSSNNSNTEKIHKVRPKLFKKSRNKISDSVFDDVFKGEDSVINSSQKRNIEKSKGENDSTTKRTSIRTRSSILKQIDNEDLQSEPESLNESNSNMKTSANLSAKNKSLKQKKSRSNSTTSLSLTKQNQISESDESSKIISQPRKFFFKKNRERVSENVFDYILSDRDKEDHIKSSKAQQTKYSHSESIISNQSSNVDKNHSIQLRLSPTNSEVSNSDQNVSNKIHHSIRNHQSMLDHQPSKLLEKYESDISSTISINEELKTGNLNQVKISMGADSSITIDNINTLQNTSISNKIISDDSDGSNDSDKLNPMTENISIVHSKLTNNENSQLNISTEKSHSQSNYNIDNTNNSENISENQSNTSSKIENVNTPNEHTRKSNVRNKIDSSSDSMRELTESIEENITTESETPLYQRKKESMKLSVNESKIYNEERTPKDPSKMRSRSRKISVEKPDSDNNEIIATSFLQEPPYIQESDEEIITKINKNKSRSKNITDDSSSHLNDESIFDMKSIAGQPHLKDQVNEKEPKENNNNDNNNKYLDTPQKSLIASVNDEKYEESTDESDSDSKVSRDPSAYELPDMNRSDSVTLSDSDNDNYQQTNTENTSKNLSPEKNHSPVKNKSKRKNKSKNTTVESSEFLPGTSGIQKKTSGEKSSIDLPKRKSNKANVSSNQRSILNFLTSHSSRPIRHEPLPTQAEVQDFTKKLQIITKVRDEKKELQKQEMEKELEEMRIELASKKKLSNKKISNNIKLRKKPEDTIKAVDKAFIVNGKVYKQPKLPRPKHWATDRLYKYLWKILEPKYKLQTRVCSEKFVLDLSNVVTTVMRRKKYDNYKDEVDILMKKMAHLGIIKTPNDFYHFCYDFLPYEFRAKVTPILLPGNKLSIPYDPQTIDIPILNA